MSLQYESLRPFKNGKLLKREPPNVAYLWPLEERTVFDDDDLEFLTQLETGEGPYTRTEIMTYHSGSHYALFKPDLGEVLDAMKSNVEFKNSDRFYVTTVSCDSDGKETDSIYECYDGMKCHHHGLTTVYYLA